MIRFFIVFGWLVWLAYGNQLIYRAVRANAAPECPVRTDSNLVSSTLDISDGTLTCKYSQPRGEK